MKTGLAYFYKRSFRVVTSNSAQLNPFQKLAVGSWAIHPVDVGDLHNMERSETWLGQQLPPVCYRFTENVQIYLQTLELQLMRFTGQGISDTSTTLYEIAQKL